MNSTIFKKTYPRQYRKILKIYNDSLGLVFDKTAAIALYLRNEPPPRCEVCNCLVSITKKFRTSNPEQIRCKLHVNTNNIYSRKDIDDSNIHGYKIINYGSDNIVGSTLLTIECQKHNNRYKQKVSDFIKGMQCQKCYHEDRNPVISKKEWIDKCNQIHNYYYDYTDSDYKGTGHDVNIMCPVHGVITQNAGVHLRGHGCKQCAASKQANNARYTTEQFVLLAKSIHGNKYDYTNTVYHSMAGPITFHCATHGDHTARAGDHIHCKTGCPQCGFDNVVNINRSAGEIELQQFVESLGVTVIPSYRELGFEIDLYLPEYNIGIEYNGLYWHCELSNNKSKYYHVTKWNKCKEHGITLYTVLDCDYNNKTKKEIIQNKLRYITSKINQVIGARKITIDSVTTADEFDLLDKHHIQGRLYSRNGSLGGYYNGKLVSVINWCIRKHYLEITRYCSDSAASYPGLFSKMLAGVLRTTNYSGDIVSFSNNDHSNGKVYASSGFKAERILGPSYWYTNNYTTLYNRQKFMKQKIKAQFGVDIKDKTETELMFELGFDRYWDTGKIKWVLKQN